MRIIVNKFLGCSLKGRKKGGKNNMKKFLVLVTFLLLFSFMSLPSGVSGVSKILLGQVAQPLYPGLIGWYKFDEGGGNCC